MPPPRRDALEGILGGALGWLEGNLHLFPGNTQATLELAILRYFWARSRPADARLESASRLLCEVWRDPGFREQVLTHPYHAHLYELLYQALAPADGPARRGEPPRTPPRHESADLPPQHLAFLRLEARYYAELAGIAVTATAPSATYDEVYRATILGTNPSAADVSDSDAYLIAHIAFYLSDFGGRVPPLSPGDLDQAAAVVAALLERCVLRGHNWDLASELVLAQHCLGGDPCRTRGGQDAIAGLAAAQLADGSLPGRVPVRQLESPAADCFRGRYHSTLAVALMATLVSACPPATTGGRAPVT